MAAPVPFAFLMQRIAPKWLWIQKQLVQWSSYRLGIPRRSNTSKWDDSADIFDAGNLEVVLSNPQQLSVCGKLGLVVSKAVSNCSSHPGPSSWDQSLRTYAAFTKYFSKSDGCCCSIMRPCFESPFTILPSPVGLVARFISSNHHCPYQTSVMLQYLHVSKRLYRSMKMPMV